MSTSTQQRTTWVCANCASETAAKRKRCRNCGTSRY
jgi:RNA polymerase subunit RPABC4/transcription elongation factor Spt4